MRVAISSHTFPPDPNGTAVILERLITRSKLDLCLVSTASYRATPRLGTPRIVHVNLPPETHLHTSAPLLNQLPWQFVSEANAISQRATALAAVLREQGCDVLVTGTGEWFDLIASDRAARAAGVPHIIYVFDWYAKKFDCIPGTTGDLIRLCARRAEGPLLEAAAGVIVVNEFMRDEYSRRHGVTTTLIRLPTGSRPPAADEPPSPWPRTADRLAVVFTGAIYQAHYDAFRGLLAGISALGDPGVRLVLFTDAEPRSLEPEGIVGPIEVHPRVPQVEVDAIQRGGDILFLPLAFETPFADIVRTSLPSKLSDYLVSGRPILVHAPEDSVVSWFCREHDCAVVVSSREPRDMAAALERLRSDEALRERIVRNAVAVGAAEFLPDEAARRFDALVARVRQERPATTARLATEVDRRPRPRVSVVIPTFNRAAWVCEAVESALAQAYEDLEVIVVDDGSKDGTGDILRERFGDAITYVRQENRGASAARNRGLELANGDFVAFLDADDLFLPGKLERQVALMLENPDAVLSHTSYRRITATGEPLDDVRSGEFRGWLFPDIILENRIATPTVMIRRCQTTADVRFDERLRVGDGEDLIFWTKLARRSRFVALDEVLSAVRMHGNNVALDPRLHVRVLENLLDFLSRDPPPMTRTMRRTLSVFHASRARAHAKVGSSTTAARALLRAYATWPFLVLKHVSKVTKRALNGSATRRL